MNSKCLSFSNNDACIKAELALLLFEETLPTLKAHYQHVDIHATNMENLEV